MTSAASGQRRILVGLAVLLAVLAADQASKWWILYRFDLPARGSVVIAPFLNFTMVWNHAVTFGMFGGLGRSGPVLFCVIALLAVIALLWQMTRTPKMLVAIATGGIAGGAIGNVIDRMRFGAVVDFIHAHAFGWSWYVFNVADSAIVCGVALWLIDTICFEKDKPRELV
ncbi:signal peptidase II [Acidomonas methanolica]|uniref:signal peptidase II n=1 Tax=Acidomonas methanolica TaxID=437 RepID=UPI002119F76E|nr:signal peptidase II [Acidomonas methanolica]MCQ9156236.1 signal peptidase II [Acidomonas methanolica]